MKKLISLAIVGLFLCSSAFAVDITFTYDDTQASKIVKVIDRFFPIPQTCDEEGENCTNDRTYIQQFKWIYNSILVRQYNRMMESDHRDAYTRDEADLVS